MRVHIYQEEIPVNDACELIEQTTRNGEKFYGLRVWLNTCQALLEHSTAEDDDRSAVTFWAASPAKLAELVQDMALVLTT